MSGAPTEDDARAILAALETGWNRGDGEAFAEPFAEDADFVDIRGDHHRGRGVIARGHQEILDSVYRGSSVRYELESARAVAGDVTLVHAVGHLDAPEGPMAGKHTARFSMVLVPEGGEARVAAFHNTLLRGL